MDVLDASGPIHCVENHDSALTVWRNAGVVDRVLLHIDAHHDMYGDWIVKGGPRKRAPVNIANFVYPALEDGLVREVIWVVPDRTWATAGGRRDIVHALRSLDQGTSRGKPIVQVGKKCITGTALRRWVRVCTVENLPELKETVLLDIDVDYLIIPDVGYREMGAYGVAPWCWPSDLVARLAAAGIRTDLTTIAYSVEGGYTPLQWKYLGDELAQRLKPGAQDLAWAESMREAVDAARRGDFDCAQVCYTCAHQRRPENAAPLFHLAHLQMAAGQTQLARDYLRRAREIDSSYQTPHNNAAMWYLDNARLEQAQAALERTLELDPGDAYAHLGCGLLAIHEGKWSAAESSLRQALALDHHCIDAYRALGKVQARRANYAVAIDCYERFLKLALSKQRALMGRTNLGALSSWGMSWTNALGVVHARLARLHAVTGALPRAIVAYRMAIAAGLDTSAIWLRLAVLYARTHQWRDFIGAMVKATKRAPRDLSFASSYVLARSQEIFAHRRKTWRSKAHVLPKLRQWI